MVFDGFRLFFVVSLQFLVVFGGSWMFLVVLGGS